MPQSEGKAIRLTLILYTVVFAAKLGAYSNLPLAVGVLAGSLVKGAAGQRWSAPNQGQARHPHAR